LEVTAFGAGVVFGVTALGVFPGGRPRFLGDGRDGAPAPVQGLVNGFERGLADEDFEVGGEMGDGGKGERHSS
jgi:hypothetical protein